jgi:hypothetical protein
MDKQAIYSNIRDLLLAYCPPYEAREGKNVSGKQSLELWAKGSYEVAGRKRSEVYFAGAIIQKSYVGFYFMPVYSDPSEAHAIFSEQLLKRLKGKSCFHITDGSIETMSDIKHALAEGFKLYKQRGWL